MFIVVLWNLNCLVSPHKFIINFIFIAFAAHSAVVLKAETVADKVEWINKISKVIQPSKGLPRGASSEGGPPMRQSLSDGSLVSYWL